MKPITTEHIVMACILGMFIRDMVIEFKPRREEMGRATEFIDFLTSDNVDDTTYSHLEIRDEDGKILKKYLKLRREFLTEKKSKDEQ